MQHVGTDGLTTHVPDRHSQKSILPQILSLCPSHLCIIPTGRFSLGPLSPLFLSAAARPWNCEPSRATTTGSRRARGSTTRRSQCSQVSCLSSSATRTSIVFLTDMSNLQVRFSLVHCTAARWPFQFNRTLTSGRCAGTLTSPLGKRSHTRNAYNGPQGRPHQLSRGYHRLGAVVDMKRSRRKRGTPRIE